MQKIKLHYTAPRVGGYVDKYLTPLLRKRFDVELDSRNPDIVISSLDYTDTNLRQKRACDYIHAIQVFFTDENIIPDFNTFDYGFGSAMLNFGDRYLRHPEWVMKWLPLKDKTPISNSGKKFCYFENGFKSCSSPIERNLFSEICKYKNSDSSDSFIKESISSDRIKAMGKYKFVLVSELSIDNGYTTARILEPLLAGAIPIYCGNPQIAMDFNPKRIILANPTYQADYNAIVEQVKILDENPALYTQMVNEPIFSNNKSDTDWENELLDFFEHIIVQPDGFRRAFNGRNAIERKISSFLAKDADILRIKKEIYECMR